MDDFSPGRFYELVLSTAAKMPGVLVEHVGLSAYRELPAADQPRALLSAFGCYTSTVLREEAELAEDRMARNPDATCLEDHDRDHVGDVLFPVEDLINAGVDPGDVEVNALVLCRLLDELELLRRRVVMLREQGGEGQ